MHFEFVALLGGFFLIHHVVALPVTVNEVKDEKEKKAEPEPEIGVHYEHYLKQVIKNLETDENFKQQLEKADMADITSGKIAEHLDFVNHKIRSQLDELKRKELNRLREYARRANDLAHGFDRNNVNIPAPGHLDFRNEHTFEVEDLKRLMLQTTRDLEEMDRRRREEFKQYEMRKEHERREGLQKMDEDSRKKAELEHEQQIKRHKDHPKVHHPGSKQQLEEVWEKKDELPVNEFDPKTFFRMHDVDGNDVWDPIEIASIFEQELGKMYDRQNPDDDMKEREEEMYRMRDHVINETDTNQDGVISLDEFTVMTKKREFNQDPGWEGLDDQQMFSEQELAEYEQMLQAGVIPPYGAVPPGYHPDATHPGAQYQHVPPEMMHQPQGYGHGQQNLQGMPHQQPQYQGMPHQQAQYQGMPHQQPQYQGMPHQQPQYQGIPQQQPQYQGIPQQPPHYQGTPQQQAQYQGIPQQQAQYQGIPQQQAQYQGIPQQQPQYQGIPKPQVPTQNQIPVQQKYPVPKQDISQDQQGQHFGMPQQNAPQGGQGRLQANAEIPGSQKKQAEPIPVDHQQIQQQQQVASGQTQQSPPAPPPPQGQQQQQQHGLPPQAQEIKSPKSENLATNEGISPSLKSS